MATHCHPMPPVLTGDQTKLPAVMANCGRILRSAVWVAVGTLPVSTGEALVAVCCGGALPAPGAFWAPRSQLML